MNIRDNLLNVNTWIRALYIVFFWILLGLVGWILGAVVVVQFFIVLFTGERNKRLVNFGGNLGQYLKQIAEFICFVDDEKPFPFSDFPDYPDED
ncbi:MAG: DUF4389 domain-containing protein [Pseudomonadales bacterium]